MGLDSVVRRGVAIADKITRSLQPYVSYAAWTGQDGYGLSTYAAAALYPAIVDQTVRKHRTSSGQVITIKASVLFLRPLGAAGTAAFEASAFEPSAFETVSSRQYPVDPRDKIILPDGTTGPIVDSSGFVDRGTGRPYYHEVLIGA